MFVGGAEASQKGLGDFIPARFTDRSAIVEYYSRSTTADEADDADQKLKTQDLAADKRR
jgi:hypothetical protein